MTRDSFEDGDDKKLQDRETKEQYVLPPATSSSDGTFGLSNNDNVKPSKKSTSRGASPAPLQLQEHHQQDDDGPLTPPLSPAGQRQSSEFEPSVAGTNKRQIKQLIKGHKKYQQVLREEERIEAERIEIAIKRAKAASKYEKKFAQEPIKAQKLLEKARSEEYKCKTALADATLRHEKAMLETKKRQGDLDTILSHLESLTTETGGQLDTVEGLRGQKSAADIDRTKRHSMAQQTVDRARGSLRGR